MQIIVSFYLIDENIKIQNSVLLAVPIPHDYALNQQLVESSIQTAIQETR